MCPEVTRDRIVVAISMGCLKEAATIIRSHLNDQALIELLREESPEIRAKLYYLCPIHSFMEDAFRHPVKLHEDTIDCCVRAWAER